LRRGGSLALNDISLNNIISQFHEKRGMPLLTASLWGYTDLLILFSKKDLIMS
jgi:hypothetical protein